MLLRCTELRAPIRTFMREASSTNDDDDDDNNDNTSNSTRSATLGYDFEADKLLEDKWEEVEELVEFLQGPYKMTKQLEGNNSRSGFRSMWQVLANLQVL
jgi:hypothetical protein